MKYGLFAINYGACADPDIAVRVAKHAEAAGLESVWTGEHLVLPDPGPASLTISPTLPFLDTVVAITLVAAETRSINVASGIIELPLHHPVTLAKQLASIDHVSRGRLIVGLGAGYIEAEFAALGVELSERGGRMDEHLAAMRALWTMPNPEFHGRFVDFAGVNAYPRPFRPAGPPVVLGGMSSRARHRAIGVAHGWYCFNTTLEWAREATRIVTAELGRHDRPTNLGPLEITMTPIGPFDRRLVDEYENLGVDRLVVLPRIDAAEERRHQPVSVDDILRTIDIVADVMSGRE